MNKKKISMIIMGSFFGLMILGLGIAGLVNYLSEKAEISGKISSPMLIVLSSNTFSTTGGFGGETQTITATTTNQANVPITGMVENIVTNSEGVTCADFDSVIATTTDGTTTDGPYDLIALNLCNVIDSNNVQFSYGPTPITWIAGQVDVTTIEATFNQAAVGTYTFSSQVVIPTP